MEGDCWEATTAGFGAPHQWSLCIMPKTCSYLYTSSPLEGLGKAWHCHLEPACAKK